jgi:cell wall-associated NlpC family hydrolase
MSDYIEQVIGKPWVDRATGPDAFDCWGLVVDSFKRIDGIEIPLINGYEEKLSTSECTTRELDTGKWQEVIEPRAGLVFVCEKNGEASHVGRMIDDRHCLHSPHGGAGVQVNRLAAMQRLNANQTYRFFVYA